MAVFKCKMCGGNLEIQEGMTVCECEYCGSNQTVPSLDDEKKVTLFTRANRLRSACEFDKAFGVYESIVTEFNEEAEAYWGLILCKYGIEYVDDPKTGKKIPTCHRSSFDSVMDDENFEMVMEYSDPTSRSVYREEAKAIETLRVGIIEVSAKEEPYDIFICYKETDPVGQRTIDSVIAQDVYDVLTEKGYRVFFSRITLEDKLGQEYEPYIFAALNSAKIMLAFGTDYEYYNAVWVKNEWSRFLSLIEKGEKKTLIPCYKGIDAYDMPKEFARLQAQDMGKVGAIQDLVRGIGKILPKDEPEKVVIHEVAGVNGGNANVDSLLKRAFMFLEDGNWRSANEYCEKVLDQEPECAQAYLGKLMAKFKVKEQEELKDCSKPFDEDVNYIKVIRFADDSLKNMLIGYVEHIKKTIENKIIEEKKKEEEQKKQELEKKKQEVEKKKRLEEECDSLILAYKIVCKKEKMIIKEEKLDNLKEELSRLGNFSFLRKQEIGKNICALEADIEELKEQIHKLTTNGIHNTNLNKTSSDIATELSKYENGKEYLKYINIRDKKVGEYISYGKYGQKVTYYHGRDKVRKVEKEEMDDIEWLILEVRNDKMLVISKYVLLSCHVRPDWEKTPARRVLNEEFYKEAFSAFERNYICCLTNINDPISDLFIKKEKNENQDHIFILNYKEYLKYFTDKDKGRAMPTRYASGAHNESIKSYKDCVEWALRGFSRIHDKNYVPIVKIDGTVDHSVYRGERYVGLGDYVRPAMWISLEEID